MLDSRLNATGTYNGLPTGPSSTPPEPPARVEATPAASVSADEVELSQQVGQEAEGTERVDSLLEGIQSWDESKAESPTSKQAGAGKILGQMWQSRQARAARSGNGARQAADEENSTCQRIAGGATAIGNGASFIATPWTQAIGRGGQALGALGTYLVCPLIDNRRNDEEIRRIRQEQQQISDRIQAAPAPVVGERWRPGSAGAGR